MATVREWLGSMLHSTYEHARGGSAGGKPARGDETQPRPGDSPSLSPAQRAAVVRGAEAVQRFGGVVLADAVGLGKTRVAVAMARRIVSDTRRRVASAGPVLFAVPARLRDPWRRAIGAVGWQCGRDAELISHHRLSRRTYGGRPPVVVVDEAHRFRNPDAKRSRHLARLTARTPPILVTATPVCTRRRDLFVLLDYFLTDPVVESLVGMGLQAAFEAHEAGEFDIVEILQNVVIRRRRPDFGAGGRPKIRFEMLEYDASDDEAWMWKNLEPRLRKMNFAATGEFWPKGLLVNNLLRMWESGPRALQRSLEDLIHFHRRWLDAAAAGRGLERPEFTELFEGVDRRQCVFAFVYDQTGRPTPEGARKQRVHGDLRTLRSLAERVRSLANSGGAVQEVIAEAVDAHSDEKFLIFTAYRASAAALFEALSDRGVRAGLVTGDTSRATGLGAVSDGEVLDRFRSDGRDGRPAHRRLRVVVATDCLSEGVNLQRCSNLILADLPYSPVRLEQRIGRIARPGSAAGCVTVYLPRPKCWTDSLGLRGKISRRINAADDLGAAHTLLKQVKLGDGGSEPERKDEGSGPLAAMTLQRRLARRLSPPADREPPAFVRAESLRDDRQRQLWVRVRSKGVAKHRQWVCFRAGEPGAVVRLADQIPGLAKLADDRREVVGWEPEGRLWERARRWVERREARLTAARLAPPLVGKDAAAHRAWRLLCEAIDEDRLQPGDGRLQRWRRRLLQAHPPGIRCELNELLDEKPQPRRIVAFAEGLAEPPKHREVDVEIVGALFIGASA